MTYKGSDNRVFYENLIYAMIAPLLLLYLVYTLFINKDKKVTVFGMYAFLLGMILVAPAAIFEENFTPTYVQNSVFKVFLTNTFIIGFIEEFFKLAIGFYLVKRLTDTNINLNSFLFIVFSAGVGFAFLENIIYVYNSGFDTALMRSFSSVPMHGATAIVIGLFGFLDYSKKVKLGWLIGLLIAMIMHGVYNVVATELTHGIYFYGIFAVAFLYTVISVVILLKSKKPLKIQMKVILTLTVNEVKLYN